MNSRKRSAVERRRSLAPGSLDSRVAASAPAGAELGTTLDGSWDRRLRAGAVEPDRVLDLHGMSLDARLAARSTAALEQAIAGGERVVLLITGHHRPGEPPVAARQDPRRGPRLARGVAPRARRSPRFAAPIGAMAAEAACTSF